ncbi:MAG: trehalose-phosphatase [Actinomycetota bacterium]
MFLFLDYDGTLVGIKKKPQDAKPSKKTRDILLKLAGTNNIVTVLVSGRPIGDLLKFFNQVNISNINFIGTTEQS